jgi:uncharacterized protein (TIGR02099 family)
LEHPIYNRLGTVLWRGIVLLLVLLAIYVSVGRMLVANLSGYRNVLLRELNERIPFSLDAQQVRGEWQAFTPVVVLTSLRVTLPGATSPPLELSEGRIGVDVLNSLRTQSLQLKSLDLNGLDLRGELSERGELRMVGLAEGSRDSTAPLREFLLNVESMALRENRLLLTLPSGETRDLVLDLNLERDGSERRLQAALSSTAGARVVVLAQGLGDPFKPEQFAGQGYVNIRSTNLGAMRDLVPTAPLPAKLDGAADLELWLGWDRGEPTVQARLEARDLLVAAPDASWQLPLQQVALEAQLRQRADGWAMFVSGLQLEEGGIAMTLPKLQLELEQSGLRLRATDVPLEPIGAILARQSAVPESLREACAALRPRGRLPLLQARFGDVDHLAGDWEAQLTFADIAVDSWHGAPGVTAARGYAGIEPGGASVVLDSQSLSLDFPNVYRAPLHFDELHGSLRVDWNADGIRLDSGLLTARGEEGTTKVLFGLDIPLQPSDVGIEMDLLVGLQDSHARHRAKYIPYVLNPTLLSWLGDSIGEGSIERGAFLWRGSLRSGAAPLRTVQLAFNIADTQMTYHPRWPPVLVREGTVLINDSAVSVWASRASLFDSAIERLSVETRLDANEQITLDVSGSVHGPAADGFRVLNESPLTAIVGEAFTGWTAAGQLDTELAIHMNLGDNAVSPQVEVTTRWRDVDLLVVPGNLPVQAVNGDFNYSTTTGFSSRALTGTLWDETLDVALRQSHGAPDNHYDPAVTVVDIALAADVEMTDLRDWLQLDFLAFASGQTATTANIRLAPGAPPLLAVESELSGVSLDLPQPWNKTAHESRLLHVEVPLAPGVMPLSLSLSSQLNLRVDIVDGELRGGAVGIGEPAGVVTERELRVAGHAPLVRVNEWLDFVAQYTGAEALEMLSQAVADGPAAPANVDANATGQPDRAVPALELVVEELRIDSLVILEQELHDVVFSLASDQRQWSASLETDWLRADVALNRQAGAPQLSIEHFDLDHLPDFGAQGGGGESAWDLPVVEVDIANLFQTGRRLGDLRFELQGQGMELTARNITGELAELNIPAETPGLLAWHRGQASHTELKGSVSFADLGETLAFFDYQRIVETEQGNFDVALRWPGAPQDFALSAAEGSMQVKLGRGSFLEATAGASGALRVVSILNLADIVRRLSLSNMFESGIPFDSVDGEVELGAGRLNVARMDVKGGSSFQFSGVSDLKSKTIDAEMVATLPVANNLPWIAALAASLPVAAGVYVISQVFDQQMSQLSSAVYTITGTWQDPELNFDRIFDNSAQAVPEAPSGDQSAP